MIHFQVLYRKPISVRNVGGVTIARTEATGERQPNENREPRAGSFYGLRK